MAEPLALQNASLINKLLLAVISAMAVIVIGIAGWGFTILNASVEDVKKDINEIQSDVKILLLNEPRLNDLERRIEDLEDFQTFLERESR